MGVQCDEKVPPTLSNPTSNPCSTHQMQTILVLHALTDRCPDKNIILLA
jgi:hypothetical protein